MKLYNVRVRLAGQITNEVNKENVTAAEIAVLTRIHGPDAAQGIVQTGSVKGRSDAKERARLAAAYPKGPSADGKQRFEGDTFIASVFGVSGVPLPQEYVAPVADDKDEVIEGAADEDEVFEELEKPMVIARVPSRAKKQAEAAGAEALLNG